MKVRVTARKCGAWWQGDVFDTSESHAHDLVSEGLVEIIGTEAKAIELDYENKSIILDEETKLEHVEWPDWLWESPRKSLLEAGVTPQNLHEKSVEDLTAIYRIGESTAKKLLAWAKERETEV